MGKRKYAKEGESYNVLERWYAMDRKLGGGWYGLRVSEFATEWDVSERTVRRDLEAFKAYGKQLQCKLMDGHFRWGYTEFETCMFHDNQVEIRQ